MMINGNPNWEVVEELALEFLMMSLSQGEGKQNVNMDDWRVKPEDNFCGTPACHGGWYAVYACEFPINNFEGFGFSTGMRRMNNKLGSETGFELETWASKNPELWGNKRGAGVFSSESAFGKNYSESLTLKDISDHWMKVAERLHKIQVVQ